MPSATSRIWLLPTETRASWVEDSFPPYDLQRAVSIRQFNLIMDDLVAKVIWKGFTIYLSCSSHPNSYSSEVYFTNGSIQSQLEWLTNDLKQASKPENRAKRPWIIAFGHRPMYCSNIDRDDCTTLKSVVRNRWGVQLLLLTEVNSSAKML